MKRATGRACMIAATILAASLASLLAPAQQVPSLAPTATALTGRAALNRTLNSLAAQSTASRVAEIEKIHTRAEAEARQQIVRQKIQALIGSMPRQTPLHERVMGQTQADGFVIRKVAFDSQPGFPVTALLYIPGDFTANHKHPALLLTPGHYPTSKASDAGTAALFALNGFVVLSYDPIGQGERLQYPDPAKPGNSLATRATGEHGEASLQPMLIGDTFSLYEIWDAMRGVDYLSNLPEVDPHRIGALGCSGGGAVTAMTAALDKRIAAIGVACFITSYDTLLPAIGAQEGEQSIPQFISSGFDFPDWIELAAPRPYAVIATYSDMFPFAGARDSVIEARRFYSLFDPLSAGESAGDLSASVPPTPTGPAWNTDTTRRVSPAARLQFITGPGTHGTLRPVMPEILSFFIRNLEPDADADHPVLPAYYAGSGTTPPLAASAPSVPESAFQVTATGQVATSFPGSATVFSLNKKRAAGVLAMSRAPLTGPALIETIEQVTGARSIPGTAKFTPEQLRRRTGSIVLPSENGITLEGDIAVPDSAGPHPAVLMLVPDSIHADNPIARANKTKFDALAAAGNVVLAIAPRPSPPGTDDMKSPLLGPFYLLSLRADIVGRTLLGLRIDDAIRAIDYLSARTDVNPARISAFGSGHMGLVLLHAAVLDARIGNLSIDHVLTSYRSLVDAPLPIGAPEDVLPGVLLHYDLPDLARALGTRLNTTDPLSGSDDLSQTSTPLHSLAGAQP